MKRVLRMAIGILALGCCTHLLAHESPVDQIPRSLSLWVEGDRLQVRYEEQLSERSALLELYAMDRNRDGVVQDSERDAFLDEKVRQLIERLRLSGTTTPRDAKLKPVGSVVLRRGYRQVYEFEIDTSAFERGPHNFTLTVLDSRHRPGPFQATIGRPSDLPPSEGRPEKVGALSGTASTIGSLRGRDDAVSLQLTL